MEKGVQYELPLPPPLLSLSLSFYPPPQGFCVCQTRLCGLYSYRKTCPRISQDMYKIGI